MVFDVLDRGKSLLLPSLLTGESFDNFVSNCGSHEMSFLFLKIYIYIYILLLFMTKLYVV